MYTATADSLALPLALDYLLSEPKHGKLLQGNKLAVFPYEDHYIYIPNEGFIGIEEFEFLTQDGIRMTLIIHVNESKQGCKLFVPFIKQSIAATNRAKLQPFA